MEYVDVFLSFISGVVIRLGLPIVATALVIILLRKLDNRWKAEAVDSINRPISTDQKPCWDVNQCSPEAMENCLATQNPNTPCWQLFRNDQGLLNEECLGCDVFRLAPLPVIGD